MVAGETPVSEALLASPALAAQPRSITTPFCDGETAASIRASSPISTSKSSAESALWATASPGDILARQPSPRHRLGVRPASTMPRGSQNCGTRTAASPPAHPLRTLPEVSANRISSTESLLLTKTANDFRNKICQQQTLKKFDLLTVAHAGSGQSSQNAER
jgi:hypothetical protein